MLVFTEKNNIEGRSRYSRRWGSPKPHFKATICGQSLSACLQLINIEVSNFLTEQDRLANDSDICLVRTVIDCFAKEGGDGAMV